MRAAESKNNIFKSNIVKSWGNQYQKEQQWCTYLCFFQERLIMFNQMLQYPQYIINFIYSYDKYRGYCTSEELVWINKKLIAQGLPNFVLELDLLWIPVTNYWIYKPFNGNRYDQIVYISYEYLLHVIEYIGLSLEQISLGKRVECR